MKALIVSLLVCAPLLAQDAAMAESTRSGIEKAILEVNAQMTQAGEARDIDRLFTFMLPNDRGSIAMNGNLYLTREAALANVKAGARSGASVKYRWKNLLVTVLSPGSAVLVADGESEIRTAQNPDNPIVVGFAQTVVFVLADGRWKALHAHQSALPR